MKRLFSVSNFMVVLCSFLIGVIAIIILQKTQIMPIPLEFNRHGFLEANWMFELNPIVYIVIVLCIFTVACILLDLALRNRSKYLFLWLFAGYGFMTIASMVSIIFFESQFKMEVLENYFSMATNISAYFTISALILITALCFVIKVIKNQKIIPN